MKAALAAREWPNRDPVGESIAVDKVARNRPDFGEEITLTVIGVAASLDPARRTLADEQATFRLNARACAIVLNARSCISTNDLPG